MRTRLLSSRYRKLGKALLAVSSASTFAAVSFHESPSFFFSPPVLLHCENEKSATSEQKDKEECCSTDTEPSFHGQCLQRQVRCPSLPYPAWDFNWDGKMSKNTTPSHLSNSKNFRESRENGVTRHILLIRHGQYNMEGSNDAEKGLTQLGRRQADLTGQRLALMARGGLIPPMQQPLDLKQCEIRVIHVSDMQRAKETADIIASHLPGVRRTKPDPALNEALPNTVVPPRPDLEGLIEEVDQNHERIEKAFQKYINRSTKRSGTEMKHEFEIIVCHGNVIRYFFCRALQIPPEAWLRMATFNCSITYLMIQPNGYVSARTMGDIGHLGYEDVSFSGSHGLNW